MGLPRRRAQTRQRAPTGVMIRQRGQIGVSQRPQRSAVSTCGSVAQRTTRGPSSAINTPCRGWFHVKLYAPARAETSPPIRPLVPVPSAPIVVSDQPPRPAVSEEDALLCTDRHAVVTGASTGIGRATAL